MGRVPPGEYPLWVKFAIWGSPTRYLRSFLIFYTALCLMIASSCVACAIAFKQYLLLAGGVMTMSALWYWFAMRLIDEYGSWSPSDFGRKIENDIEDCSCQLDELA
jgi:hypothetical protein